MWTVAACQKKAAGLLDASDSFGDKHLAEYFRKRIAKQRLAHIGVVPNIRSEQSAQSNYCYCCRNVSPSSCKNQHTENKNATGGRSCQCHETTFPVEHSISPYLLPVVSFKAPALKNREIRPHAQRSSVKATCEVILLYHGGRHVLHKHKRCIKILQQHCGGTPRVVFYRHVAPGETFTFPSHRRFGHAFSVVLFVDEIRDVQLSSCCEYRYNKGSRLAKSLFSLVEVKGGSACYKCRLEGRMGGPPGLVPKQMVAELVTTPVEGAREEICPQLDFIYDTMVKQREETYERSSSSSNDHISLQEPDIIPEDSSQWVESKAELNADSDGCPQDVQFVNERGVLDVRRAYSLNEREDPLVEEMTEDDRIAHDSETLSTAYNVREKKNQWGPDPSRGESFSSDEDNDVVVTIVTADVHVPP